MESQVKKGRKRGPKKGYRRHLKQPPKGCRYRLKKFVPPLHSQSNSSQVNQIAPITGVNENCEVKVCLNLQLPQFSAGLKILSLFDGIGTAYFTLQKLGIEVAEYYSCEIDKDAISVLEANYHGRITMLGSVLNVTSEVLQCIGNVDLLFGASPCQDLSLANWRRRGFKDKSSSATLFFEFVRVLKHLQIAAAKQRRKFYYLFENTAAMETCNRDIISRSLGCEPVKICASRFVAMTRKRLFWGNIPYMADLGEAQPHASHTLQEYLKPYQKAVVSILPTLTTCSASQRKGKAGKFPVQMQDGTYMSLPVTAQEKIFGLTEHFTDTGSLTISQRRKLLGNSWSVHVIEKILEPLKLIFK